MALQVNVNFKVSSYLEKKSATAIICGNTRSATISV